MWGCVIGLQRETPPLKKKKNRVSEGTLTSPPASLLRSRRAPEQRPAPLPSFPSFFSTLSSSFPGGENK